MILYRSYLPECTIGRLTTNLGELICYTVERPWANNERFISCIPEGDYSILPYASPNFGESLIIVNNKLDVGMDDSCHRWGILFHAANVPSQLQGCIAPITDVKPMCVKKDWEIGGTQSRKAMKRLLNKWESDLLIKTYAPFNKYGDKNS